jgi:hypothetical protein
MRLKEKEASHIFVLPHRYRSDPALKSIKITRESKVSLQCCMTSLQTADNCIEKVTASICDNSLPPPAVGLKAN